MPYFFLWAFSLFGCLVRIVAGSFVWFVLLLVREEVLLASLCERKILFRLKIYDRLANRTGNFTRGLKTGRAAGEVLLGVGQHKT